MADTTQVATLATPLPSRDDIERASKFTREPFLPEGEDAAAVLAPGTAHRRAFDAALAERPDLVLWQVGTNAILRDASVDRVAAVIGEGVRRLKAAGAEIVISYWAKEVAGWL